MLKNITAVLIISTAVVGCSQFSDEFVLAQPLTEREKMIEQELNLPPQPDNPDEEVLGVDSNDNLIRDEVERKIAFKFYPEMNKIAVYNALAQKWTETIIAAQNGDENKVFELSVEESYIVSCSSAMDKFDGTNFDVMIEEDLVWREYLSWLTNTLARERARGKVSVIIGGSTFSSLSDEEQAIFCQPYNSAQ